MPSPSQRVTQQINGREYRIEVSPLGTGKWRAQILTRHGGPSALMPFYGPTPESAVGCLAEWLARAHAGHAQSHDQL